jgi:hypothetical protein
MAERWKGVPVPRASRRSHLLAAAILWTAVGAALFLAGTIWMSSAGPGRALPAVGVAILLGWIKARYVLNRAAVRIVQRIEDRGDDRCLGGFLSWKSWLLVMAMMVLGRLLRRSPLPLLFRGLIYAAIGAALVLAGTTIWRRRSTGRGIAKEPTAGR